MLLHFLLDEKVSDQIISNFRKVDEQAIFLIFVEQHQHKYQHIKSNGQFVLRIDDFSKINDIIKSYSPCGILIHAFHLVFAKCLLELKQPIKIGWYSWGFDVYGLPRIKPKIYAQKTEAFILKAGIQSRAGRIVLRNEFLRKFTHTLTGREDRYSIIFRAMQKISYFVTYLKEDYEYFSKHYPNKLEFIYSPFSTLNQYLGGIPTNDDQQESRQNLLVGNSCSLESNHLDVIDKLKTCKFFVDVRIYFPLSYGIDNQKYLNQVIQTGKKTLGEAFIPMLDFLDRGQYIKILGSCSTGIFYHYRQQAMGNIIAMLYQGARIYMSNRNPAFQFFVKKGIQVYDFDKDFDLYGNTPLPKGIVHDNRRKLEEIFSEEQVLKDLRGLLSFFTEGR
jgi:hypothetical protein